jgi:hypothetical protein
MRLPGWLVRGRPEWQFSQEPREHERECGRSRGGDKNRMKRIDDGRQIGGLDARREFLDRSGTHGRGHVHADREPPVKVACEMGGEDGAEAGDAHGASDLAEQNRA